MNENEITNLSLNQAATLIAKGDISITELVEACISRIELLDGKINSFITFTPDSALQRAKDAEKQLREVNRPLGPLFGIPVAYKDLFETAGIPTTCGSKFFKHHISEKNATVIEKLNSAGVISVGKLNMHEIALGVTNVNPHFGACRNPWAVERISGGSSGGSAAALSAGFIFGSMGSDTGGSIRIPSSLCGTVGLKPTRGRISLRGVLPLSATLDHAGPMARTVLDTALLFSAAEGYDADDPYSVNYPVQDFTPQIARGVKGWRVAVVKGEFYGHATKEVLWALQDAAYIFEDLGAVVELVPLPEVRKAATANGIITVCDAASLHRERLKDKPGDFGEDVRRRLEIGAETSLHDYIKARTDQTELCRIFERFFERYDILITPTTPVTAPMIEGQDAVQQARLLTSFTAPFNLTGLPAISIPGGISPEGLPIGLQIISGPWAENRVLRAAYAFEQATNWQKITPVI